MTTVNDALDISEHGRAPIRMLGGPPAHRLAVLSARKGREAWWLPSSTVCDGCTADGTAGAEARMGAAFVVTLMAVLCGAAHDPSRPDAVDVRLQVTMHGSLDRVDLERARVTAQTLLASASLQVGWSDSNSMACATVSDRSRLIQVLLMPTTSRTDSHLSGIVTRQPGSASPTVVVYVPALVDRAHAIQLGPFGRSNPLLAQLHAGHLVGLTIAHEVGHALGLHHSTSGLMRPRVEVDDVLALRAGRLAFTPEEAARMRASLRVP